MSVVGNLSRHEHFAEFNVGLETNRGYMSPADRKAEARANLGLSGGTGGVTPQVEPTALVDNSGGTASGTLAAITDTATKNAVASLNAQIDALTAKLVTAGVLTN
jgi:hypothetical protein